MKRPSFDDIYMELADSIAKRSQCVKRKVGAVISQDTRVISTGYNGPPAGTYNCAEVWPEQGCARSLRGGCLLAMHAEHNAILYAMEQGLSLKKCTLYITLCPCLPCARLILSVGIQKVLYRDSYAEYKGLPYDEGVAFLEEFGLPIIQYKAPSHTNP